MAGVSVTIGTKGLASLDALKNKSESTAKSIKDSFSKHVNFKSMLAGVGVGAAIGAAFYGLEKAVVGAIDAAGELNDLMARTGANGEGLVILQQEFANVGLEAGAVPLALGKMQKALAGVNEEGEPTNTAFERLGLNMDALQSMDPVDAFNATAQAIAGIENPARRTAMAMEIFGKSGASLLPVMRDAGAFEAAKRQVGGLGKALTDNKDALDAVGDSFGALKIKGQQVGVEIAVALLPELQKFSQWLDTTDFGAVGNGIGDIARAVLDLAAAAKDVVSIVPPSWIVKGSGNITANSLAGKMDSAILKTSKIKPPTTREEAKKQSEELWKVQDSVSREVGGKIPQLETREQRDMLRKNEDYFISEMERRRAALDNITDAQLEQNKASLDAGNIARQTKAQQDAADEARGYFIQWQQEQEADLRKAIEDTRKEQEKANDEAMDKSIKRNDAQTGAGEELAILDAQLAGNKEKVKQLELEAAIRARIADLMKAGVDPIEAYQTATDLETRKAQVADMAKSPTGYQSTIGAIAASQRIGGGGGAAPSVMDYARQSNDLQRQMVTKLTEISRNVTPNKIDN